MMKRLKNGMYIETVYYVVDEDDSDVVMLSTFKEAREWIKERIIEGDDICYGIVKVRQLCEVTKYGYTDVKRFKVIK